MNRIYRTIWNEARDTYVAASEIACRQGKRVLNQSRGGFSRGTQFALKTLAFAVSLAISAVTLALPTGGQIAAGQGAITQSGNTMSVTQGSQNLIVNWQGFGIGTGEKINFAQPNASAIALNRVLGNSASQIYGQLNANGQVYLINANGILFAPSAQVNVGGLVASTLDISDASFLAGKRTFVGNGAPGKILNQGSLNAANGGFIALLGGQVSNQGTITARLGTVALGAGNQITLDFAGDHLTSLQVNQGVLHALVENGQLIQADGGTVIMTAQALNTLLDTVLNNSGVIEARGVSQKNGRVVLDGGISGVTSNSGVIDVSNTTGIGGTAKVLGDNIQVGPTSMMDASGNFGGGTILIGGNAHGAGPEQNATTNTVVPGALFKANATDSGNGGTVVVWADGSTHFDGAISAQGGANGGDGGFVETSGKNMLQVADNTTVNTLASKGRAGNWLLDPATITVGSSGSGTLAQAANTTDTTSNITLSASTINAGTTNVILAATTSITVNAAIGITTNGVGITFEGAGGTITSGPISGTTLNANVSAPN
ncbi:MAG: filamentous hemagglutinin N-terminal domain-containing protein, partial [Betaproteobacteria bacterium]|nr:filamentous hemagglutinin N-terminal domain-containing protein [Betaproteobacteria bacterium]